MNTDDFSSDPAARRARNLETVEAYFRLQSQKDLDAWFQLWAENGAFVIPYAPAGLPERIEGRKQLEPIYRKLFEGYGELRYHELEIQPLLDPNKFVATWITDVDLLAGGTYTNKLIALFTLRDGEVVRYDEYFDPTRFGKNHAE